ncbi:MAG: cell division FtsZ family protein [Bacteroidales bacterium]|nr:cell division FtsZ family protein [Bacteroidales bacterium]MBQ8811967.1 cell division FtsZ family protein [Bacteroidales bacterium]
MEDISLFDILPDTWIPEASIIKVICVGGGGCNAVNYMYNQRIAGCTFIVCNTDSQSLERCDVPLKIQIGDDGLGAGTDPRVGRKAALNSQDLIEKMVLDSDTKMLFITAGMGGGTDTGAAPVIASMAPKRDILTVGVVTIPFRNRGKAAMANAIDGISELENNVDSLLIIDNEKLFNVYGDLHTKDALPMADEVLATAVRGIIEIIKKRGYSNVDFKDVWNMMRNDDGSRSKYALMGCGTGTGPTRIEDAVKSALESPLLNDFDLSTAKNVLVNITTGENPEGLTMSQYGEVIKMIEKRTGMADNFKSGLVFDENHEFGDRLNVTVIVTGINVALVAPQANVGNIIAIESNFKYDISRHASTEGIVLPHVKEHVIGFGTSTERKKLFDSDAIKPILLVSDNENRSELEAVSALKRKMRAIQNSAE